MTAIKIKHSLAGQMDNLATLALALALPNLNLNASPEDPVADVTAPTITSLAFAPATVDVTEGGATVKLTISISDDLAGVDLANPVQGSWDGMITLNSPGGLQQIPIQASDDIRMGIHVSPKPKECRHRKGVEGHGKTNR